MRFHTHKLFCFSLRTFIYKFVWTKLNKTKNVRVNNSFDDAASPKTEIRQRQTTIVYCAISAGSCLLPTRAEVGRTNEVSALVCSSGQ
jgi:hypothetical protein